MTTAEMIRLRDAGLSHAEIAARAGLTKNQVTGRMRRGAEPLGRVPIGHDVIERGKRYLRSGMTHQRVADLCGVSVATVHRWSNAIREARDAMRQEMRAGDGAQGDVAPVAPATVQPAPTYSADPYVASLMARGLSRADAIYSAGLYRQRRRGGAHAQV